METTPLAALFPLCASAAPTWCWAGRSTPASWPAASITTTSRPSPNSAQHRERLRQVASRHGVDLAAAALQFGVAHPVVAATIPGASSPEHLRRNAGLMHIEIPAAFWEELRAEGLVPPDAPLPPRKAAERQSG
jgi:D-threo-aldose 1-dehydrogenase